MKIQCDWLLIKIRKRGICDKIVLFGVNQIVRINGDKKKKKFVINYNDGMSGV